MDEIYGSFRLRLQRGQLSLSEVMLPQIFKAQALTYDQPIIPDIP